MRVRTFELRLIAVALSAGWTLTAALVLLVYRPGGPFDLLVGVAAGVPIAIALLGLAWPPVARGDRAFAGLVWLGLGTLLLLVPSIGGVLTQLLARGPQTLLPSPEAAYPWLLALLGTSLFSGLGLARQRLGETALRRRRLVRGSVIGIAATAMAAGLFTTVAIANESALRDLPAPASRFGPTDAASEPPTCDQAVIVGPAARVDLAISGDIDQQPLGSVEVRGVRTGSDVRWLAYVATDREIGQFGAARIGGETWALTPDGGWQASNLEPAGLELDAAVLAIALEADARVAAEDHGLAFVEGARARHCRVAIDGSAFRRAFPEVGRLVGDASLARWRGELDYWVFGDGQLGRVSGGVSGNPAAIVEGGLQGTLRATLTATDRDRFHRVARPTP